MKMEDGIQELHRIINSWQINSVMLMHLFLAASSALLAGEKDAETLLKDALELFDKRFLG